MCVVVRGRWVPAVSDMDAQEYHRAELVYDDVTGVPPSGTGVRASVG